MLRAGTVRTRLCAIPFCGSTRYGNRAISYRAWSISWPPFAGLFIARVSRGHTLRECIGGARWVST